MAQAPKEIIGVPRKPLIKVVQEWEEQTQLKISDVTFVELIYRNIGDLDAQTINSFTNCTKLSLSSNFITKIPDIHLNYLETLSLGRNKIRYIKGLDWVAGTLKNLWLSYNEIDKLDPLKPMLKLVQLYMGNNLIAKIDELNNLVNFLSYYFFFLIFIQTGLSNLNDVVFRGNPFALVDGDIKKPIDRDFKDIHPEIKKRIPSVDMIDGEFFQN